MPEEVPRWRRIRFACFQTVLALPGSSDPLQFTNQAAIVSLAASWESYRVTCPVNGLLMVPLFRFAIEAAHSHLFQCTAYMFQHAVAGPLCIQGRPSLKSTCAEKELHKPSGLAATDWQACSGSFSALPARL